MNISSQDQVRALYDESAESYAKMMDQEIQLPIYEDVLSKLAAELAGVSGSVLDSSCGTGHMLERVRNEYCQNRELVGVDISPKMIEKAKKRLGDSATLFVGDMGDVRQIPDDSCAAVISFFAVHHVDLEGFQRCLVEWRRTLVHRGALLLAAWEGEGRIDYGETSDVVARRYRQAEVVECVASAGFDVVAQSTQPVEDFEMDAIHVLAAKE